MLRQSPSFKVEVFLKKEDQREEGVTLCCSRLHLSRTKAKLSWHRCAASSAAHPCVDTNVSPLYRVFPHSTLCHSNKHYNQTLVLLIVQCDAVQHTAPCPHVVLLCTFAGSSCVMRTSGAPATQCGNSHSTCLRSTHILWSCETSFYAMLSQNTLHPRLLSLL